MKGTNNFNLDINMIVIIVGIVAVLYCLKIIITNQEEIIKKLSHREEKLNLNTTVLPSKETMKSIVSDKKGSTKGDASIIGIDNDETIAVILSAVSYHTTIPLKSLKVKLIKKL